MNPNSILVGLGIVVFLVVVMASYNYFFRLYVRAQIAGAPVPLFQIIGFTLRRANARAIVDAHLSAYKAGIDTEPEALAAHQRAGGNVRRVIATLVEGKEHGGTVTFDEACEQDLSDHGLIAFEAVKKLMDKKAR